MSNGVISGSEVVRKVEKQVVAGYKYKFVVSSGDTFKEIVAYKKLDDSIEIMSNRLIEKPN